MTQMQRVLVMSGSAIVCLTASKVEDTPQEAGWDRMVGHDGHGEAVPVALDFFANGQRVTALDLIPSGRIVTVRATPARGGKLDTERCSTFEIRVVQHERRPGLHILSARLYQQPVRQKA